MAEDLVCTYLHHQCWHAAGSAAPAHSHAHWQFEYLHAGQVTLRTAQQTLTCRAGEGLLIPPGITHAIFHPVAGAHFLSVKFHAQAVAGVVVEHLDRESPGAAIGEALFRLCRGAPLAATGSRRRAIEAALDALFWIRSSRGAATGEPLDIVERIALLLEQRGGASLTVAEVAASCGCSVRTLRDRQQRIGGETLKACIDRQRARMAADQLRYSDAPISTIAQEMGFRDVYAFSRFVRRRIGMSPSAWRRQQRPEDRHPRANG